jgi:hypothetical protein
VRRRAKSGLAPLTDETTATGECLKAVNKAVTASPPVTPIAVKRSRPRRLLLLAISRGSRGSKKSNRKTVPKKKEYTDIISG